MPAVSRPRGRHDHRACIGAALAAAAAICAQQGGRLTPLRRRVLELVWQGHEPVGAYALLARLRRERRGAAPPTVYRALDFLIAHGLVHRVESLNAFVGCPSPTRPHDGQFLICTGCGCVEERADAGIRRAISRGAAAAGFALERPTVEVRGLCAACARKGGRGRVPHGC